MKGDHSVLGTARLRMGSQGIRSEANGLVENYGPTSMGNSIAAFMGYADRRRANGPNLLNGSCTRDERSPLDLGRSGSGSDSARIFSSEPLGGYFGVGKNLKNSSLNSSNSFTQPI